jgi:hypothetical protein
MLNNKQPTNSSNDANDANDANNAKAASLPIEKQVKVVKLHVEIGEASSVPPPPSNFEDLPRSSVSFIRFSEMAYAKYPTVPDLVNALSDCVHRHAPRLPSVVLDVFRQIFVNSQVIKALKDEELKDEASLMRFYLRAHKDISCNHIVWRRLCEWFFKSLWVAFKPSERCYFPDGYIYRRMKDEKLLFETDEGITKAEKRGFSDNSTFQYCEEAFLAQMRRQAPTVSSLIDEIIRSPIDLRDFNDKYCVNEFRYELARKYDESNINKLLVDFEPLVYAHHTDRGVLLDTLFITF